MKSDTTFHNQHSEITYYHDSSNKSLWRHFRLTHFRLTMNLGAYQTNGWWLIQRMLYSSVTIWEPQNGVKWLTYIVKWRFVEKSQIFVKISQHFILKADGDDITQTAKINVVFCWKAVSQHVSNLYSYNKHMLLYNVKCSELHVK